MWLEDTRKECLDFEVCLGEDSPPIILERDEELDALLKHNDSTAVIIILLNSMQLGDTLYRGVDGWVFCSESSHAIIKNKSLVDLAILNS